MPASTASTPRRLRPVLFALSLPLVLGTAWLTGSAWGHGDTAPQPVDTGKLPKLGTETWLASDPFRTGEHRDEALEVGARGYNANCARCHGLEAVSGGIAPDLRKFDEECSGYADAAKKKVCFQEMDDFYAGTVRRGRTRDGRVYMPPFEGTLTQEAVWAIRTYLEERRAQQ